MPRSLKVNRNVVDCYLNHLGQDGIDCDIPNHGPHFQYHRPRLKVVIERVEIEVGTILSTVITGSLFVRLILVMLSTYAEQALFAEGERASRSV